ncbi:MAG: EutN/CcmL family microcompartment protein [Lachnospiraceae bacterium]|nr:EutN/CcmL family microcompartment protein [Lachnospiraceae bacterium]
MYIAKVIGTVVATRKEDTLVGTKFMIIQRIDKSEKPVGDELVAADFIGAGIGEIVLVGTGSSVRVGDQNRIKPLDAAIIGIIDEIQ